MHRRTFLCWLTLGTLCVPILAEAQAAGKFYRVGWLVSGSPISHRLSLAAFKEGLQKLGYTEGRNIRIEYRWAEGDLSRLPQFASELVRLQVDVILAGGTAGASAARDATREIPIVMAGAGDPVEAGLVTSLARPGGNLTGFAAAAPESASKRLELLKEAVPKIHRVAVIWNPTSPTAQREWNVTQEAAKVLGLVLVSREARNEQELKDVLTAVVTTQADSMMILNDPFVFTYRKIIADSAIGSRLPSVYGFSEFVDAGGFMSYGAVISDTYRRAAAYVDKILKGAKPRDLPVEHPTKFELVINLKTAKALGLTIPPSLLLRADQVIE
jgi:putative tryptophan/tyrosine transport system substrate-binding protein